MNDTQLKKLIDQRVNNILQEFIDTDLTPKFASIDARLKAIESVLKQLNRKIDEVDTSVVPVSSSNMNTRQLAVMSRDVKNDIRREMKNIASQEISAVMEIAKPYLQNGDDLVMDYRWKANGLSFNPSQQNMLEHKRNGGAPPRMLFKD